MTKEEYEKLLQSDYWKGFSYSLIKERDFTCEDCGRTFYNQSNKLQVHHLVYRDINPWSYKPEEMVVLCEECHKKRHGFIPEDRQEVNTTQTQGTFGDYTKAYSYSTDVKEERMHLSSSHSGTNRRADTSGMSNRGNANDRNPHPNQARKGNMWKNVSYAAIILLLLSFGVYSLQKHNNGNNKLQDVSNAQTDKTEEILIDNTPTGTPTEAPTKTPSKNVPSDNKTKVVEQKQSEPSTQQPREKTVTEILEERTHNNAVRRAEEVGASTEGTTTEILERITRKNLEAVLK